MARIKRIYENEDGWSDWISPTRRRGHPYRLVCCDCGLAHDVEFQVIRLQRYLDNGRWVGKPESGMKVLFRARRNKRSTSQIRRAKG